VTPPTQVIQHHLTVHTPRLILPQTHSYLYLPFPASPHAKTSVVDICHFMRASTFFDGAGNSNFKEYLSTVSVLSEYDYNDQGWKVYWCVCS